MDPLICFKITFCVTEVTYQTRAITHKGPIDWYFLYWEANVLANV